MNLRTLSCDDVIAVHEALANDFAEAGDPIAPCGVRSMDLLESAVSRQHTALGTRLKYEDPIGNAATLMYGLCCDHPFHNGNKRTALVSMLVHLDENRLALWQTTQSDLYAMVLSVADHSIGQRLAKRGRPKPPARRDHDEEVAAIADWIARRCERVRRGEQQLTYRGLRRVLEGFGYFLENPDRNAIEVVRYETRRRGLLRRSERVRVHVTAIGWPGEHRTIGVGEVKRIRRILRLTEADGIDSDVFYNRALVIDSFVNTYRTTLRRLARR